MQSSHIPEHLHWSLLLFGVGGVPSTVWALQEGDRGRGPRPTNRRQGHVCPNFDGHVGMEHILSSIDSESGPSPSLNIISS